MVQCIYCKSAPEPFSINNYICFKSHFYHISCIDIAKKSGMNLHEIDPIINLSNAIQQKLNPFFFLLNHDSLEKIFSNYSYKQIYTYLNLISEEQFKKYQFSLINSFILQINEEIKLKEKIINTINTAYFMETKSIYISKPKERRRDVVDIDTIDFNG